MKTQIRCCHWPHASASGRSGDPHLLNLDTIVHLSLTQFLSPHFSYQTTAHAFFAFLPGDCVCLRPIHRYHLLPYIPSVPFRLGWLVCQGWQRYSVPVLSGPVGALVGDVDRDDGRWFLEIQHLRRRLSCLERGGRRYWCSCPHPIMYLTLNIKIQL